MTDVRLDKETFEFFFERLGWDTASYGEWFKIYGIKFILEEEKPIETCKTCGGYRETVLMDGAGDVHYESCPDCEREEPKTEAECRLESAENHIKALQEKLSRLESEVAGLLNRELPASQ